jgi:nucleotidyltransferase/DNA polymerase involved in DNA repair
MTATIKREQLPEVMEIEHIRGFLGIGKSQAYKLANSGKFRIKHVGQLIKIPRDHFLEWFDSDDEQG